MSFRLSQDPLRTADLAAELLARQPDVRLVFVFGSAVDSQSPGDLDLAIWVDTPLSLHELTKRRADVVLALQCPLDLVSLNDASTVLAHEVVEHGRCLYARSPEDETEFVTETRRRFWDFKPFRDEQQRLAALRVDERLRGS